VAGAFIVYFAIGPIQAALFGASRGADAEASWIAPDEAMPDHPSVLWRKKHLPRVVPAYLVNSILTVAEMVEQGLGVGILPLFLARRRPGLVQLGEVLDECQSELWLLTHAQSRHLRRVSAVFGYLAEQLLLERS
jgi:DNA-binding transcriptional LysR family regulator